MPQVDATPSARVIPECTGSSSAGRGPMVAGARVTRPGSRPRPTGGPDTSARWGAGGTPQGGGCAPTPPQGAQWNRLCGRCGPRVNGLSVSGCPPRLPAQRRRSTRARDDDHREDGPDRRRPGGRGVRSPRRDADAPRDRGAPPVALPVPRHLRTPDRLRPAGAGSDAGGPVAVGLPGDERGAPALHRGLRPRLALTAGRDGPPLLPLDVVARVSGDDRLRGRDDTFLDHHTRGVGTPCPGGLDLLPGVRLAAVPQAAGTRPARLSGV